MAVIQWALCLVMLTAGTVYSTSPIKDTTGAIHEINTGNWSVGDCILAKFAMEFTIHAEKGNASKIALPTSAVAQKDNNGTLCSKDIKKVQTLTLSWKEPQKNNTKIELNRLVQVNFLRMENGTYYGVNRIYGEFEIAYYKEKVTNTTSNKTHLEAHLSVLTIDSKKNDKLMFHTPNDKSYLCADVGEISLLSQMKWNYTKMAPHDVENTTVSALHVQFDAFRNIANGDPEKFRTSIDCDYQPNDIVPIAVGVALAALVVAVLIAYMVGRRRNRQAGYQSV